MGKELELCCKCEEPTGRAGRSEDSLYADDLGPFCEKCWGDLPDELAADLTRLRAELEKAEAARDEARDEAAFVRRDKAAVDRLLAEATEEVSRLRGERAGAYKERDAARAEAECHSANHDAALELLEAARRERDEKEKEASEACDAIAAIDDELADARRSIDTPKARADAAEALLREILDQIERGRFDHYQDSYKVYVNASTLQGWRHRLASPGADGGEQQAREAGDA